MAGLVQLTEVSAQIMARILASVGAATYGTITDVERFPAQEITDAALDADAEVCLTFLQKAGNGRRAPFLQPVTVANGALIPTHIGEIDSILLGGQMPVRSDPVTIARDRANFFGSSVKYVPKIYIWGDTLWHNYTLGGATVTLADFTRTGACQSPSECSAAVICIATGNIIAKNGNHVDAAQLYHSLGLSYLGPIARGETNLAPLATRDEVGKMLGQAQSVGGAG